MDTISLGEAGTHVGRSVRFIAAVQRIATGKRVLVARQRVQPCHILHVGDASRQFFKVSCWGDTPPTLIHAGSRSESDGDSDPLQLSSSEAVLRVGDIVLFSFCRIKSYRGNVEAQFVLRKDEAALSSTVQLLYRKGRYFSTQDVSLKDLYPMIEWYKQHCREFLMGEEVTTGGIGGSELDGVLLCELIMYDSPRDVMTVNLWDQHAEKRFVARLLGHRGAVEIDGIVVSLQVLSNRLLANTTPHTTFRLIDPDDQESIELENKLSAAGYPFQTSDIRTRMSGPITFSAFEELGLFEGQATLDNVRVEQVCLGHHLGNETKVLPKFAPLLVERYCTGCDQALPELLGRDVSVQPRFGSCPNQCKTRRGSNINASCGWRYRRFSIILRDSRSERLQVELNNEAIVEMMGNIEAQILMKFSGNNRQEKVSSSSPFDAASAVASLLNALVEDASQKFEVLLGCSTVKTRESQSGIDSSYADSSNDEELPARMVYNVVSLTPSDEFSV
ncbi:hypothetical protein PHMEG_00027597 [Phytophthora megakarya]|uniref:Uncharacterized protein n=1 Tax=Phytophthora megakarya TaxID=4795 RepID=A0A225V8J7_9STRA|nr:hypothetical protein PHMEG_00027597 [Phytophthora megakarya]